MERKELLETNRKAWNVLVAKGNRWTVPVGSASIEKARGGTPEIMLTPQKLVPQEWFPKLAGCKTLLLAGGGGQQAPLMAAAGAEVTVVDLSESQLEQDQVVARREGLSIRSIQSSMDDLCDLAAASFDLVIHPCSNSFVPDINPVWREAARVTRSGGVMMAGFCNPLLFLFDDDLAEKEGLKVTFALPYSDQISLPAKRYEALLKAGEPLMFGHTLEDQIGGQLQAGFAISHMFEDSWGKESGEFEFALQELDRYTKSFIATRAIRF
ncbi:MAG: class I SAM-dependent methyltransferase [Planctomycetota bacterium]|nr:class I SAM-dependent methyltransferase [Planctomycetota bacterium]